VNVVVPQSSSNHQSQFHATRAGAGLAMIPHFMAYDDPSLIRVLPKEINLSRDWWLVVHQDLEGVPRIRAAIDFLETIMLRDQHVLSGLTEASQS